MHRRQDADANTKEVEVEEEQEEAPAPRPPPAKGPGKAKRKKKKGRAAEGEANKLPGAAAGPEGDLDKLLAEFKVAEAVRCTALPLSAGPLDISPLPLVLGAPGPKKDLDQVLDAVLSAGKGALLSTPSPGLPFLVFLFAAAN